MDSAQVVPELVEIKSCPPFTAATSVEPSADEATEHQLVSGALVTFQVVPELVDVIIWPSGITDTATILLPSAEEATDHQYSFGAAVADQVAP